MKHCIVETIARPEIFKKNNLKISQLQYLESTSRFDIFMHQKSQQTEHILFFLAVATEPPVDIQNL